MYQIHTLFAVSGWTAQSLPANYPPHDPIAAHASPQPAKGRDAQRPEPFAVSEAVVEHRPPDRHRNTPTQ